MSGSSWGWNWGRNWGSNWVINGNGIRVIRATAGKGFVKRTRVNVFAAVEADTGNVVALGDTIVLTIFLRIIKPMNTNEEEHRGSGNKLGMEHVFFSSTDDRSKG
jgi:hypothetical protein